jgi:hypothetical protein
VELRLCSRESGRARPQRRRLRRWLSFSCLVLFPSSQQLQLGLGAGCEAGGAAPPMYQLWAEMSVFLFSPG